jgi:branched-chain amino acid transport system ATP-binding protein
MLEVRGLGAAYGEAVALWDVDLDVGDGEVVSIVGPNGAGKSTLVNTIAGLHRASGGRITMDGHDVTRVPAHRVCGHGLAIVPEGRRIFPAMSVQDNLDLGAFRSEARDHRVESLERVLQLFPRLRERSRQRAGTLSGGEQQMLAIGRALMARPRLLLMDEPSLGLAPIVLDEVFDVIRSIRDSGVSVLLVEQNAQRAFEVSARGYLLTEGRISLAGTSQELAANPDIRRLVLGV